jgi:hypothetical protein
MTKETTLCVVLLGILKAHTTQTLQQPQHDLTPISSPSRPLAQPRIGTHCGQAKIMIINSMSLRYGCLPLHDPLSSRHSLQAVSFTSLSKITIDSASQVLFDYEILAQNMGQGMPSIFTLRCFFALFQFLHHQAVMWCIWLTVTIDTNFSLAV